MSGATFTTLRRVEQVLVSFQATAPAFPPAPPPAEDDADAEEEAEAEAEVEEVAVGLVTDEDAFTLSEADLSEEPPEGAAEAAEE